MSLHLNDGTTELGGILSHNATPLPKEWVFAVCLPLVPPPIPHPAGPSSPREPGAGPGTRMMTRTPLSATRPNTVALDCVNTKTPPCPVFSIKHKILSRIPPFSVTSRTRHQFTLVGLDASLPHPVWCCQPNASKHTEAESQAGNLTCHRTICDAQ